RHARHRACARNVRAGARLGRTRIVAPAEQRQSGGRPRLWICCATVFKGGRLLRPLMAKKTKKAPFDPKVYLATMDGGRTLSRFKKHEVIFSQGAPADSVLYIQKGK